MERRRYSKEFKVEAVELARSSERPRREIAAELGVREAQLYKWLKEYSDDEAAAFPGNGKKVGLEEELRQVKRKLREVELERDILKKATAYFAKGSY